MTLLQTKMDNLIVMLLPELASRMRNFHPHCFLLVAMSEIARGKNASRYELMRELGLNDKPRVLRTLAQQEIRLRIGPLAKLIVRM